MSTFNSTLPNEAQYSKAQTSGMPSKHVEKHIKPYNAKYN